jgi:hypothetical protein
MVQIFRNGKPARFGRPLTSMRLLFASGALWVAAFSGDLAHPAITEIPVQQPSSDAAASATTNEASNRWSVLDSIPFSKHRAIKDGTSTTDVTSYLESAIAEAVRFNKSVFLPCGIYLINSGTTGLLLPSNTKLIGEGWCAIIKMGASLGSNANWRSVLNPPINQDAKILVTGSDWLGGVSNVTISNLSFDLTLAPPGNAAGDAIGFFNARGLRVERVRVFGNASGGARSDDGMFCIRCSDVEFTDNDVFDIGNACYDIWGGSSRIRVSRNKCDGNSVTTSSGVLITGLNTDMTPATTSNVLVENNIISNVGQNGVWFQGGWNQQRNDKAAYGTVQDAAAVGNVIHNVTRFHGIRASDAKNINISGNSISRVSGMPIISRSEFEGEQNDINIGANTISND